MRFRIAWATAAADAMRALLVLRADQLAGFTTSGFLGVALRPGEVRRLGVRLRDSHNFLSDILR
jgi:hypothetical protein